MFKKPKLNNLPFLISHGTFGDVHSVHKMVKSNPQCDPVIISILARMERKVRYDHIFWSY